MSLSFSKSAKPRVPSNDRNAARNNSDKHSVLDFGNLRQRVCQLGEDIENSHRTRFHFAVKSAGFERINEGSTARCPACKLEVSERESNMDPFLFHKQRRPTCPFVLQKSSFQNTTTTSESNAEEPPCKRLKVDTNVMHIQHNVLVEVNTLKQVRRRGFSHWPHRSSPSASQMIQAGFFNCNVGDRVICIYCNLICQQWTPNVDDQCEVHKTLSPKCPYVIAMLSASSASSVVVTNQAPAIVYTAACNPQYSEIPKRNASFATWPNENLPSVDDLVRAGFFFTSTKTIVTCFYCNGSLQNWSANDNPMIEHARWFPHCAYAKQLCGVELHRKIQESKRAQQERAKINNPGNLFTADTGNLNDGRLLIPDESTLSRLVAARLDLSVSQRLIDQKFKLSIVKRCWEDQLRLKRDDFVSDCDLFMACTILQKQIEYIDGRKDRITVPSIAMKAIREKEEADARARDQGASRSLRTSASERNDMEVTSASSTESNTNETNVETSTANTQNIGNAESSSSKASVQKPKDDASPTNPCVLCLTEEKRLACIPCGHLATCVPCGHSLRSCPICHREIEAFVRIYL